MAINKVKLGGGRVRPVWVVLTVIFAVGVLAAKALFFDGTGYWRVTTDVPPGSPLAAAGLEQVQLNLGQSAANYLTGPKPSGYLVAGLRAGDLLPVSAVTHQVPGEQVRVVVTSKTELAKAIRGGARVDIWAARKNLNEYDPPTLLVHRAGVVGVVEQKGMFASSHQQVEVQLASDDAPALLDALASDSAIFLVPLQ